VGLKKRDLLRDAAVIVPVVLSGCSADPTTGDPNNGDAGNTSREGSSEISETETRDGPAVSGLETDCITAELSGYVSTTPVPTPERPERPSSNSVVRYSVAYERYYNRYLALYSMGPPTPERTDLPAHGFPDVTLEGLVEEVREERPNGYVVRLSYERYFEGEEMGEYTVSYFVSEEYTIRAEVKGNVEPGPDPTETGVIMTC
jgi:hypothetical protein